MGTPWRSGALLAALLFAVTACANDQPEANSDPKVIGMLRAVLDEDHDAFVSELRAQGWALGRDVRIVPEDPATLYEDVDAAARALEEWSRNGLDLVVAFSTPYARLATEATEIPGLFLLNDPVSSGLVSDPARPDGQLTGVTFRTPSDRLLELADQLVGDLDRLGYLAPTDDPAVPGHREGVQTAADERGVELVEVRWDSPADVEKAVDELRAARVDAVALANSNGTVAVLDELREALAQAELPVLANTDLVDFALLTVTPDGAELRRQLARQAARLLAGADVGAVPVEHPRKFIVIVDRRIAQRLGLPPLDPDLLRQADVVR